MSWDYAFTEKALKELKKLGPNPSQKIVKYLKAKIQECEDPRQFGKALTGDLGEYWCYRVGDYRVLCELKDEIVIVLVVRVGHRREVYD